MVALKGFTYKLNKRVALLFASACYPAANLAVQAYESIHLVAALCSSDGVFERAYAVFTSCVSQNPVNSSNAVQDVSLQVPVSYCNLPWPADAATTSATIATTAVPSAASSASPSSSPSTVAPASTTSPVSLTPVVSTVASVVPVTSTSAARASTTSSVAATSVNSPAPVASSPSIVASASVVAPSGYTASAATPSAVGASSASSSRPTPSSSSLALSTIGSAYTTQSNPTPTSAAANYNGPKTGTIAGIAVGATIAVILALGLVIFFAWRHHRKSKSKKQAAALAATHPGNTTEKPELHSDDYNVHRKELEGSMVPLPSMKNPRQLVDIHEVENQPLSRIRSEMSANEVAAAELGNSWGGSRSSRVVGGSTSLRTGARSIGGGGAGDG